MRSRESLYAYCLGEVADWVAGWVLDGEMKIENVPQVLRIVGAHPLYIYAFRYTRNISYEAYVEALSLLRDDILYALKNENYDDILDDLVRLFSNYADAWRLDLMARHDDTEQEHEKGGKILESFRRSLPETLLSKVQECSSATRNFIETQLRHRGLIS
jgi:hypothetical protein